MFVFDSRGRLFQPRRRPLPRLAAVQPAARRGERQGLQRPGQHGYGTYGLNVGIGRLEDGKQQDIVVTYDNHQINVFRPDGTSVLASRWYTNRRQPVRWDAGCGWGQFIRWQYPKVEDSHMHAHGRLAVGGEDAVAAVVGVAAVDRRPRQRRAQRGGRRPERGEARSRTRPRRRRVMVLDGAQGGGARSARRHRRLHHAAADRQAPAPRCRGLVSPGRHPRPALVDLNRDRKKDIVFPGNDGYVYAVSSTGKRLWRYGYAPGKARTFASEVVAADLNGDGVPELVLRRRTA